MRINDILVEFAAGGSGGSGNYFKELASAWYNGTFNTGSLQKGIKSQQDVEKLLNRGIVCPDGVTRKFGIDYNSDFDGVVISSDDYYEHSDYDEQGQEVDSRSGQKWGPYDYMEFGDEELDESAQWRDAKYKDQLYTQEPPDYNDSREYDNAMWNPKPDDYPGRKELPGGGEYDRTDPLVRGAGIGRSGIKNNILDRGKRKGLPSRDQITSLKQSIRDISGRHTRANLPEQGVAEGSEDKIKQLKQDYATAVHWSKNDTNPHKREAARQKAEKIKAHLEKQYKQGVAEAPGAETLGHNQSTVANNEKAFDLEEGKDKKSAQPEADYGDDYQAMVSRVKKLAGMGPLKTVYDPQKRVYKNVPTATQPKKEQR